jgi:L-threonylcarbamoyladenylate synthase
MEFLTVSDESLARAAEIIRSGGLVAFPTETVYGLGGDAFNSAALARIFQVKNRPRFDPLIVHIAALDALAALADLSRLSGAARENLSALSEKFWPGPLTLILPKQKSVPDLATSGLPSVAVRFPAHPAAQRLIALSGGAVAAPSANPFGYLSPTRAEHVRRQLGEKVDLILDGGPAYVGIESTVLDLCAGRPRILRPGGTPKEAIEALIGPAASGAEEFSGGGLASPGQLKSHYAPRTPLSVYTREEIIALGKTAAGADIAWLFFDGAAQTEWLAAITANGKKLPRHAALSQSGSLLEAAARLFETLHELDCAGNRCIYAQLAPQTGLGEAINDRLRRASAVKTGEAYPLRQTEGLP